MISAAQANDQRFYGVNSALVTKVDDDGGQARVKLKFPWFNPDMETDWVRVLYGYAGNGYGFVWVPEVNDEVLVAFVMGDMRWPIVLGGLYNGQDSPPVVRDAQTNQKIFRTKAGNQILFDDESGEERITITTVAGNELDLNDKDNKITLTTPSGVSLTLDNSGAATLSGTSSVTLDSPTVSLGSNAAQKVILGDVFLNLYKAHTHNCTAPGTPSGPPIPPMIDNLVLSQVTKTA